MKSAPLLKHELKSTSPIWHAVKAVGFRFAVAFFGLYCLVSHLLVYLFVLPGILPGQGLGTRWPLFDLTAWVAVRIFGITEPLVFTGNSRDTNFFWVQLFVIFVIAAAVTLVWSSVDRRSEYEALRKWFRIFIRFAVAAQMIYFGMVKVIPTQFPAPSLITLLAPAGNLSLQGFLWTSIGASTPYQIFTGIVEVVGGLLLIAPRTTMLGAAICLASMIQVFVLNMTYDVGVKILSFQLVLMSLFLLAPDLRVFANVFLFRRPATPSAEPELFRTARANRIALAVQIVFGMYLLAVYSNVGRTFWYAEGGGGSAKSLLYGIWNIEALTVDGELRPAELNDYDRRWRRVIFDSPEWVYFQRTDDSFMRYGATIDLQQNTLSLKKGHSRTWRSDFTIQRPEADALLIDGQMDGHTIKMSLRAVGRDTFRLLNSRFRWIRPPDRDE
jgi:hypothetical protein